MKKFEACTFFIHGPAKIVFLGDCPEIVGGADLLGEPTIYYDPETNGWDTVIWKEKYPVMPIQDN